MEYDKVDTIKRLATEDEVKDLCDRVAKAESLSDIPRLDPNVYFTQTHIYRITRTNNPFVVEMNRFAKQLNHGLRNDTATLAALIKSNNASP